MPTQVTEWISPLRDLKKGEETTKPFNGGVAQLGEHLPCKQGVMGSNPIISTMRYGIEGSKPLKERVLGIRTEEAVNNSPVDC